MKNKRIIIILVLLFVIIVIISVLTINKSQNKNSIDLKQYESWKLENISTLQQQEYGKNHVSVDNEDFIILYDDGIKYISQVRDKDESGNEYILLEYNPKEFDEETALDYIDLLLNYDDYYDGHYDPELESTPEIEFSNMPEGYELVSHAENPENVRIVYVYWSEERAYIKCMVSKISTIDLKQLLGEYCDFFIEEGSSDNKYEYELEEGTYSENDFYKEMQYEDENYKDEYYWNDYDEDDYYYDE